MLQFRLNHNMMFNIFLYTCIYLPFWLQINQHELLQQEMIQNLIAFSQQDPNVLQKLLALLKDQQSPSGADNSGALEDLQQKLIEAQERQRREASEHFRSQEEFHQEMKRSLQETAQMQMKVYNYIIGCKDVCSTMHFLWVKPTGQYRVYLPIYCGTLIYVITSGLQ